MTGLAGRAAALCLLLALLAGPAGPAGAGEVRGVWVHPEAQFAAEPARGRAQAADLARRLARAGFNLVLAWAPSTCLAAREHPRFLRYCPTAAWDALAEFTAQCRRRGLTVHLWYSPVAYKGPGSPEFQPDAGGDPAWAAVRRAGAPPPRQPAMSDLCPQHPGARAWTLDALEKALRRLPGLSGVHLEEPGYSRTGYCVCGLCRSLLAESFGPGWASLAAEGPEVAGLKCRALDALVFRLRRRLAAIRPGLMLSANGGTDWRADAGLGRNWRHWARAGWLDLYVAQDYKSDMAVFEARARQVLAQMGGAAPVALGLGVAWSGGRNRPGTVLAQIALARRLGAAGVVLFHARALSDELMAALASGPFRTPAALPTPAR